MRVAGQAAIELRQKKTSVVGVILPGILTIHDDGQNTVGPPLGGRRDLLQVFDQIGDGIPGMPVGIGKADEVGDAVVAKEALKGAVAQPIGTRQPMLGEVIAILGVQAVIEDALAAGGPPDALLLQQAQGGLAEGTLGGPAARRAAAKMVLEGGQATADVPACPFLTAGIGPKLRQGAVGDGLPGAAQIQE